MRKLVCLIFLVLSFNNFANPRIDAHESAVDALSKLTFSKEGRGMVIAPDFIKTFELLAKFLRLSHPDRPKMTADKGGLNALTPFKGRWGLIDHDNEIKGFYNVPYKDMQIGAMGCIVCHSGKAAGQYIVGLGNKNVDVGQLATDAKLAQEMYNKLTILKPKTAERKKLEADSLAFAVRLSDNRYNNLTQGLVPISMIQTWFYKNVGGRALPHDNRRGQVKVPSFWGYGKKRFIGQFSDGFGDGNFAGWGLAVEFAATQTAENVLSLVPKISHAEDLLGDVLPPKYPFAVKLQNAVAGEKIFVTSCSKCHGTYERDESGIAIFKEPKHIPIGVVKTDDDRLVSVNQEFFDLVDRNPMNEVVRRTNLPPGYFAPRLEGIWAKFAYLHNGSVPTIRALLTEPSKRPVVWSLVDAGEKNRFDEVNLGYTLPLPGSKEEKDLLKAAEAGARNIYYTKRVGQSSKGHWFKSMQTLTDSDKSDLIEYLKTL